MIRRLVRLGVQLLVASLIYLVVAYLPRSAPVGLWIGPLGAAVLVAVVIVLVGKTLYDTLFFDHHWRAVSSK